MDSYSVSTEKCTVVRIKCCLKAMSSFALHIVENMRYKPHVELDTAQLT
jgi:hypothetical protein